MFFEKKVSSACPFFQVFSKAKKSNKNDFYLNTKKIHGKQTNVQQNFCYGKFRKNKYLFIPMNYHSIHSLCVRCFKVKSIFVLPY